VKVFSAEPGDFALLAIGEAPFGVVALGSQPTGVVAVGVLARGLVAISCGMSVGVLALSCGVSVGVLAYGIGGLIAGAWRLTARMDLDEDGNVRFGEIAPAAEPVVQQPSAALGWAEAVRTGSGGGATAGREAPALAEPAVRASTPPARYRATAWRIR
jgi:hypothetical protein